MKRKIKQTKIWSAFALAMLIIVGGAFALSTEGKTDLNEGNLHYGDFKLAQDNSFDFIKSLNLEIPRDFDYINELNKEFVKDPGDTKKEILISPQDNIEKALK